MEINNKYNINDIVQINTGYGVYNMRDGIIEEIVIQRSKDKYHFKYWINAAGEYVHEENIIRKIGTFKGRLNKTVKENNMKLQIEIDINKLSDSRFHITSVIPINEIGDKTEVMLTQAIIAQLKDTIFHSKMILEIQEKK